MLTRCSMFLSSIIAAS